MAFIRDGPNSPTMTLDDRPAHGQANSHAVRFRAKERSEKLLGIAGVEADSAVAHRHAHAVIKVEFSCDVELAWSVINGQHRICGIREQVYDHLLQLNTITDHDRQI